MSALSSRVSDMTKRMTAPGSGAGSGVAVTVTAPASDKQQPHAQALALTVHGVGERAAHGRLIAGKAEIACRRLEPLDVALEQRKAASPAQRAWSR